MNTDNKVLYSIVALAVLIGIVSTFIRPGTTTTTNVIMITVTPPAPGQQGQQSLAATLSTAGVTLPEFSDFLKKSGVESVAQAAPAPSPNTDAVHPQGSCPALAATFDARSTAIKTADINCKIMSGILSPAMVNIDSVGVKRVFTMAGWMNCQAASLDDYKGAPDEAQWWFAMPVEYRQRALDSCK